jgi:glyoxylase-like metal-dependent hydrolase (beta-lactamase superfamily II)
MGAEPVVPGLWKVKISFVNAYLLDTGDGLALIDTGIPGSAPTILEAVRSIGRQPADIRRILVTHCHADHSGSLAELKRQTGAPAMMHPVDAAMVRAGQATRPLKPSPGLVGAIFYRLLLPTLAPTSIEPAEIEHEVEDGETLAGGLKAIHVPGHCAGQLAFLWPEHRGVLIAADTAANVLGLGLHPVYEDVEEGRRSLGKLSGLDFEVACFGHGKVIPSGASGRFAQRWPAAGESSRQVA